MDFLVKSRRFIYPFLLFLLLIVVIRFFWLSAQIENNFAEQEAALELIEASSEIRKIVVRSALDKGQDRLTDLSFDFETLEVLLYDPNFSISIKDYLSDDIISSLEGLEHALARFVADDGSNPSVTYNLEEQVLLHMETFNRAILDLLSRSELRTEQVLLSLKWNDYGMLVLAAFLFLYFLIDVTHTRHLLFDVQRFKNATESATDGVLMTDNNGHIIYMNTSARKLLGIRVTDTTRKNFRDYIDSRTPKSIRSKIERSLISKQTFTTRGMVMRDARERFFDARLAIKPVKASGGLSSFFLIVFEDITEIKQAEEMKSSFISIASHQLQTPLTSIKWNLELLEDEMPKIRNKNAKALIREIGGASAQMVQLVNGLLNASRLEAGRLNIQASTVDFGKVVKTAITQMEPVAESRNVRLIIDADIKQSIKTKLDAILFQQVVKNLISNAIKYSKPGGGDVIIRWGVEKKHLFLEVKDFGIGMSRADKEKLFRKFFRARSAQKAGVDGTGLGLYIVKLILDQSRGKITVKSGLGRGTRFRVELPRSGMKSVRGERGFAGGEDSA